jgi:TPR repeat protein
MLMLADMLERGVGVRREERAAVELIRQAVDENGGF